MVALLPCPGCFRHVRSHERVCPFCDSALSLPEVVAPIQVASRLDRAGLFLLGAAFSAAGIALGCGGGSPAAPEPATPSPSAEPPLTIAPAYGAPAPLPEAYEPTPAPTTAPAPPPAPPESPSPPAAPGPVSPAPIAPMYGGPPSR